MTPAELLELIKAKSNARKQRSLEIIYSVCKEQVERGSRDFSVATIGRLSKESNGPSSQTIRNKGGLDFRALISTWADYSNGSQKKPPKVQDKNVYSILDKIEDPAIRSVVGTIIANNSKLQGEVNLLKQHAEIVIDRRTVPVPTTTFITGQKVIADNVLTSTELFALEHAISDELLNQEGWSAEPNGRIVNSSGRSIFKAGYVTAIRNVLLRTYGDNNSN